MGLDGLLPLLEQSKSIIALQAALTDESLTESEKKKISGLLKEAESKFNSTGRKLIYWAFSSKDQFPNFSTIDEAVDSMMAAFVIYLDKESEEPLTNEAIRAAWPKLKEIAAKEGTRSPFRRKVEHFGPMIIGVAVFLIYFGVRGYFQLPTFDSLETRQELIYGYDAVHKAEFFDNAMNVHVRKGGWLKGILFWPIEPTDKEIAMGAEFLGLMDGVHAYGMEQKIFCDSANPNLANADWPTHLKYAELVVKHASASKEKNAINVIADAFIAEFPCL